MDQLIQSALNTSTLIKYGRAGGGCINQGEGFMTDNGPVFVKKNKKSEAKMMFNGEYLSLASLYVANSVKVPKPIKVVDNPNGGSILITEYIDMKSGVNKFASQLGRQLAELHLHNSKLLKQQEHNSGNITSEREGFSITPTSKFGFDRATCCGFLPLNNEWNDNWVEFFSQQRLKPQVDRIVSEYGNREITELWPKLERKLPDFFVDLDEIIPSLLHGDLWSGNVAETDNEPVIFDPASFYGHSEFDFGIANMFGGFPSSFYKSYHELNPQANGFERRQDLYQLFHNLNHWNHFGDTYRNSSLSLMRKLVKL